MASWGKLCPRKRTYVRKSEQIKAHERQIISYIRVSHTKCWPRLKLCIMTKWHYTRELAQLSKAGRSTISNEFPRLVKLGILNQRREGREVYYRFNLTNPKTRKLCELFETEKREEFYNKNGTDTEKNQRLLQLMPVATRSGTTERLSGVVNGGLLYIYY